MKPSTVSPWGTSPYAGPWEMRPRDVLIDTSPQQDAGTRRLPPPSRPCAAGAIPAAIAAAEPPLDPPAVRERSHGLWVAPHSAPSVLGTLPNSGMLVLPMTMAPASRSRRTSSASCAPGVVGAILDPIKVDSP